jgi:hypothetical protein
VRVPQVAPIYREVSAFLKKSGGSMLSSQDKSLVYPKDAAAWFA